jgi:hypothetical protein
MITSGAPKSSATRKTEIVDVVNGGTCSDLPDFPVEIYGTVGAKLDGTPVVCGGAWYSEKCYRFTNGEWEQFASMKEKRYAAAGVTHNKKLHVFGGYNGSSRLQTSETISVDGEVSDGPELPTGPVNAHAMTSINDTVSLLSGGYTNAGGESEKTWYYHHDTESFTIGPDLLEGRRQHGSATNVDKVTKAKIAVVTGGIISGNKGTDTTELLIDGQWQAGTIH